MRDVTALDPCGPATTQTVMMMVRSKAMQSATMGLSHRHFFQRTRQEVALMHEVMFVPEYHQ